MIQIERVAARGGCDRPGRIQSAAGPAQAIEEQGVVEQIDHLVGVSVSVAAVDGAVAVQIQILNAAATDTGTVFCQRRAFFLCR